MNAKYENGNIIANCPNCKSKTTFEAKNENREHGSVILDQPSRDEWDLSLHMNRVIFRLLRCAGCGRAGLAAIGCDDDDVQSGELHEFFPYAVEMASLPNDVPKGIKNEFREAEKDASIGSYR